MRLKDILRTGQLPRIGNDLTPDDYKAINDLEDAHPWLRWEIIPFILAFIMFALLMGPEATQWLLEFTPIGNTNK